MRIKNSKFNIAFTFLCLILAISSMSSISSMAISTTEWGPRNNDLRDSVDLNPLSQSEFEDSNPIFIDGNDNISRYASSGDGSDWDNAYVIEEMDFAIRNSTPAIHIANTSDFILLKRFHIRIEFYDNTSYGWVGLLIENSSNIRVEYGFFTAGKMSGTAIKIRDSTAINFSTYNTFSNFYFGMTLINTTYSDFSDMVMQGACRWAIFSLTNCSYNNFHSNLIKSDGTGYEVAFHLKESSYNVIEENKFREVRIGISNEFSWGNIYRDNIFEDCGVGVDLYKSREELIENNLFESSGIWLSYVNDTRVINNRVRHANRDAITLWGGQNILVERNIIFRSQGLALVIHPPHEQSNLLAPNITIRRNTFSGNIGGIFVNTYDTQQTWGWNWYFPQFGYLVSGIGIFIVFWLVLIEFIGLREQEKKKEKINDTTLPSTEILNLTRTGITRLNRLDKFKLQIKLAKIIGVLTCVLIATLMTLGDGGRFLREIFTLLNNGNYLSDSTILLQNLANLLLLGYWLLAVRKTIKILQRNLKFKFLSMERKKAFSRIKLWVKISISIGIFTIYSATWFLSNFYSRSLFLILIGLVITVLYFGSVFAGYKPKDNIVLLFGGVLCIITGIYAVFKNRLDPWETKGGEDTFIQWALIIINGISALILGISSFTKLEDAEFEETAEK